jgi:hypothetical protein
MKLDQDRSVEFSVSYSLREYISFAQEHTLLKYAELVSAAGKTPPSALPRWVKVIQMPISTVSFMLKRLSRPVCDFNISRRGIERKSGSQYLLVLWPEVSTVHAYTLGFFFACPDRGIPVPYRCLSEGQLSTLKALVAEHRRLSGAA